MEVKTGISCQKQERNAQIAWGDKFRKRLKFNNHIIMVTVAEENLEITIAKYKENKRTLEIRIKRALENFQKENGVVISGINYYNDIAYSTGNKPLKSDITIRLDVKI